MVQCHIMAIELSIIFWLRKVLPNKKKFTYLPEWVKKDKINKNEK